MGLPYYRRWVPEGDYDIDFYSDVLGKGDLLAWAAVYERGSDDTGELEAVVKIMAISGGEIAVFTGANAVKEAMDLIQLELALL